MKKRALSRLLRVILKIFLAPELVGHWVSVKERTIGKSLRDAGLNARYSTDIYNALTKQGMIEKEGMRSGLRYKIINDTIVDSRGLAEKIYFDYTHRIPDNSGNPKPSYSKRISIEYLDEKDVKRRKHTLLSGKKLMQIPHLGQVVYALVDGFIAEARITCVRFDENDKVLVNFKTALEDSEGVSVERENYCLRNVAFSVDELIKKLVSDVKKFKNKK